MDPSVLQPWTIGALAIAIVLTAYELLASRRPETCPECPHCAARAAEEARQDEELSRTYAREHRLDPDDEDERRI